jgi:hypothetical protein
VTLAEFLEREVLMKAEAGRIKKSVNMFMV